MTSIPANSLIDQDDPLGLTASPTPQDLEWRAHLELVRQQCEEQYSSNPSYQAMVARDQEYWKTYSPGGVRLFPKAD
jgi:hypothetical protein